MSSFESLISKAIFGDEKDKADAMRKSTCKLAASRVMACQCGQILDQTTVHVLEVIDLATSEEKTLAACCPDCAKLHADKVATLARVQAAEFRYVWQTWKRTIEVNGGFEMSHVNIRYYAVPPCQKSIEQCRDHGKDHRAYGWNRQIDPRWNDEQKEAYQQGYEGK